MPSATAEVVFDQATASIYPAVWVLVVLSALVAVGAWLAGSSRPAPGDPFGYPASATGSLSLSPSTSRTSQVSMRRRARNASSWLTTISAPR